MKQSKTWLISSALLAVLFTLSASAIAGVVAIVNKANATASKAAIVKLYTLETKTWPDGSPAKLYDLSAESVRDEFCKAYTGKSADDISIIWAKAVFSGRASPPKELRSDADVKSEVARDKNAVGYVDESNVDETVKVVR
jgi:ABC-type phosphate transport system substrate-binding protein